MDYHSYTSDDQWRGPFKIDTTSLSGNILKITGKMDWHDQDWGNNKGRCRINLFRDGKEVEQSRVEIANDRNERIVTFDKLASMKPLHDAFK